MTDADEQGFLKAIEENPADVPTRLAYADWLEEHGRPYRAMLQRVEAGVSQVRYKIRRKSDGLFAESGVHVRWTATGREWEFSGLRGHLNACSYQERYGENTPWKVGRNHYGRERRKVIITEPD